MHEKCVQEMRLLNLPGVFSEARMQRWLSSWLTCSGRLKGGSRQRLRADEAFWKTQYFAWTNVDQETLGGTLQSMKSAKASACFPQSPRGSAATPNGLPSPGVVRRLTSRCGARSPASARLVLNLKKESGSFCRTAHARPKVLAGPGTQANKWSA